MTPLAQSKIYPDIILGVENGKLNLSVDGGATWEELQGWAPTTTGDGTLFLADDGTYKAVTGGANLDDAFILAMTF